MPSHTRILRARSWADREYARQASHLRARYTLRENDYAPDVQSNAPFLTAAGRAEFDGAGGSELRERRGAPPKFCAPWSSSALAANVFDYWRDHGLSPLSTAMQLKRPATSLRLEHKLATGVGTARANLDVVLEQEGGGGVAIEAKYLEPFPAAARGARKKPLADAYFDRRHRSLWDDLPELLGEAHRLGAEPYYRLDAPQLMKHILALRHTRPDLELMLLWYSPPDDLPETREMKAELERFSRVVRTDRVQFRVMTYQELFQRLRPLAKGHRQYIEYLESRYFPQQGRGEQA